MVHFHGRGCQKPTNYHATTKGKMRNMKISQVLCIFLICKIGLLHAISVGKFMNNYMNAPNNAMRQMLVDDMLGEIKGKPIREVFDDYDEREEREYEQMLKNRDFLRTEDREHLEEVLKYTKVASSKWGKILLHPEKIPNPSSFLQWDMKKFMKRVLTHQKTKTWISQMLVEDIEIRDVDKIQKKLRQQLGDKYDMVNDYIEKILAHNKFGLDPKFQSWVRPNDTRMCMDSLVGTWGYPLDVLGYYIRLILWQIVQTIITDLPELCSTDPGSNGEVVIQLVCGLFGLPDDQCQGLTTIWPLICIVLRIVVPFIEVRPLQEQQTLIPTIASKYRVLSLFFFAVMRPNVNTTCKEEIINAGSPEACEIISLCFELFIPTEALFYANLDLNYIYNYLFEETD